MALFPDAVLSLITRSPFEQARDILVRGRGIKDAICL